jgi:2-amino-4-hydroxy-6-hydroxymethyldihydropteridine diphosphokinase
MVQAMIYLSLGSNLGDRQANLETALSILSDTIALQAVSPIYETKPWGYLHQPNFLNCACAATTILSPPDLLQLIHGVEESMGRKPNFRYGPRLIDLDILLYDDLICQSPSLEIPHPRLAERAFVIIPLADVAKDVIHPILKEPAIDLAARVEGKETVRLWSPPISLPPNTG